MTTHTSPAHDSGLLPELEHAHVHARAALDDPEQNSLAAVTWASAHLAAVERVLYPTVCRVLPDGRARARAQRTVDHQLQLRLWELDRRLTGDVQLQGMPLDVLEDGVRRGLQEHERGERELVSALGQELDGEQLRELGERLAEALMRSPTRPHPDTRHGRFGAGLAFWFDGVVDRMRDSLDSRSVPTPHRTSVPRPVTRWGAYALGAPLDRVTGGRQG